ncbi:MAG: tRNA threonylcarbamoyladenosine biosynthesis protein TsaE [Patescibacteria group bacterium]|nr:tRNA threonylcarbamoyladenosine biosynthesis protein TsaE [Patescibacteria group bacterium]
MKYKNIFNTEHFTKTLSDTESLALALSKNIKGNEVLLFFGNLGAGKTAFIKFLAKFLGVKGVVSSPTFNILKIYDVKGNEKVKHFCHIDAYRLNSGKELIDLGIDEILIQPGMVTAIEWAEKIKDIYPSRYIKIEIEVLANESRLFKITKR